MLAPATATAVNKLLPGIAQTRNVNFSTSAARHHRELRLEPRAPRLTRLHSCAPPPCAPPHSPCLTRLPTPSSSSMWPPSMPPSAASRAVPAPPRSRSVPRQSACGSSPRLALRGGQQGPGRGHHGQGSFGGLTFNSTSVYVLEVYVYIHLWPCTPPNVPMAANHLGLVRVFA